MNFPRRWLSSASQAELRQRFTSRRLAIVCGTASWRTLRFQPPREAWKRGQQRMA